MKKSLMIISFAFIFLLTLSVVSAGLWITGDALRERTQSAKAVPTSVAGGGGTKVCQTDSDCSSGQTCQDGVCGYSSQYYYCAGGCAPIAAGIGSGQCATQQSDCRAAHPGDDCGRCRAEAPVFAGRGKGSSDSSTTSISSTRSSRSSEGPRGWIPLTAKNGETCYRKPENKGRLFGR